MCCDDDGQSTRRTKSTVNIVRAPCGLKTRGLNGEYKWWRMRRRFFSPPRVYSKLFEFGVFFGDSVEHEWFFVCHCRYEMSWCLWVNLYTKFSATHHALCSRDVWRMSSRSTQEERITRCQVTLNQHIKKKLPDYTHKKRRTTIARVQPDENRHPQTLFLWAFVTLGRCAKDAFFGGANCLPCDNLYLIEPFSCVALWRQVK